LWSPRQSTALVEEVRTFLAHKEVVGGILFVTMQFFSALAFTILENAMSVIFYHRVKIKRRHFLVSAVMPYLFMLFLGVGLLIVTVLSGVLQFVGTRSITILGQPRSLDQISVFLLYSVRGQWRNVASHRNLFCHAGRAIVPASRADWRGDSHHTLRSDAPRTGMVLYNDVANPTGLRLAHHRHRGAIERGNWRSGPISRCTSDRGI
jgi:hypothetical protein